MHIPKEELKQIILDSEIVSLADYELSEKEAQRSNATIEDILIGNNLISEKYLVDILAKYLDIPAIDLSNEKISFKDIELLSESDAKKKNIIVFGREKQFLKVAMTDPLDLQAIEYVKTKTGRPLAIFMTSQDNIKKAWKRYKRDIGKEFHEIIKRNVEQTRGKKGDLAMIAQDLPIISIFDTILDYAIAHGSSDIHIEVFEKKVIVRFRVDGILHDIIELPLSVQLALIARIKILSNLQIDEHQKPQDGRFKFRTEDQAVSIRVSIMPTFHGEKAVMRILTGSSRPLSLSELGLSDHNLHRVEKNIKKTQGLILITGPTGSGKTTTLYSMLHLLNKPEVNICTIEDPIEYDISRINQTQVNSKSGITFAQGLKSFLRQNPNIIMVGEIRDKETLEMAIHASLTGHLVLSTLHTNNAALAIPRLINMGAEPFLIASTLNLIIAQRLVRKNCSKCLSSQKLDKDIIRTIKEQIKLNPFSKFTANIFDTAYTASGCKSCSNSGYHGQIGIYETLEITSSMKNLIIKKASGNEIKKLACEEGMTPMFEDGLEKIQTGQSTITEVFRSIRD
ncbi:GspE/PulE family protein [Patescibacteria group bacterium]|nr:GspE/PulE family protein [Patescibacteria group bacterium]